MNRSDETKALGGPPGRHELARALGPLTAVAIVIGTVIGSGVFKKPAAVALEAPQFGVAISAWILMAGLVMLGALALAEVAVLFPKTGGNFVFLRESFGRPFAFMWGWIDITVIRTATIAALAVIFAESLHDMLRQLNGGQVVFSYWQLHLLAQGTIFALGLVNVRGVRWGGGLQVVLTAIKVGGIVAMALLPAGLVRLIEGAPSASAANFEPVWPDAAHPFDLLRFGAALIAVQWAYHGWMNLGPVAGEVRHPQRNIPIALLGGVAVVAVLYVSLNVAFALVMPQAEIAGVTGQSVAAVFCRKLLGPVGGALAAGVVMCSVFGALNGNVLVGPRLLFAMGEDRLAPRFLNAVHPRYGTPARAILTLTFWSMLLLLGGGLAVKGSQESGRKMANPFDLLTDFAMFGAVIFETLAVASIFVFRRTLPDAPRTYRCPGYPAVPIVYVAAMLGVVASYFTNESKLLQAGVGLAFTLAGAGIYWGFLKERRPGTHEVPEPPPGTKLSRKQRRRLRAHRRSHP